MIAKSAALRAHERLLGKLSVRTVNQRYVGLSRDAAVGWGKQGICKPIEVNRVIYKSKNVARKELHVASDTIDKMLKTGEAKYVVPKL